ncbi:unnamed protein product [Sphagnum balticum]
MDTMTQKDNPLAHEGMPRWEGKSLGQLFEKFGVRRHTIAKMSDMAFTVNTLVRMTEPELDEVIQIMLEDFLMGLLLGERYGLKVAVRVEKKTIEEGGL